MHPHVSPAEKQTLRRRQGVKIILSVMALGFTGGLLGCDNRDASLAALIDAVQNGMQQNRDASGQKTLRLSEAELTKAGVLTALFKAPKPAARLSLTACVSPDRDRFARVAPRVEGQVIKVAAGLGDEVSAGQELAVISSIPLSEAQAEYRRAETAHRLAEADYQRADDLFRRGVTAQRFWQEASAAHVRAATALRLASDRLQALGASPGDSEPNLTLLATFNGVIVEKTAVAGELAGPDRSLFTVADLSSVWVEADVLESDMNRIAIGMAAAVTAPAYPGETFQGTVTHLSSMLDRQTRTMKARIETPNVGRKLYLNMFVAAEIQLPDGRDQVASLPEDAVVTAQGRSMVYVRTRDGFEARPIEAGERTNGRVSVTSGLADGEEVAVAGASALKDRQFGPLLAQVQ